MENSARLDTKDRHSEKGTALVAALWLSLILALLSIAVISIARKNSLKTKIDSKLENAWVIAEGGVPIATHHIADRSAPWRPRAKPYDVQLGDEKLVVFVETPQAKIDLNGASPALLASLFSTLGFDDEFSVQIGDRIADWRDEDELIRLNGAEKNEYLLAGLKAGPENLPFKAVYELNHVLGMDHSIFECVAPYVTVFAPNGRIDPYSAGALVRKVVGLGEVAPDEISSVRRSSLAGQVYEIRSQYRISDQAAAEITSIIRYTGNPADPVWRHSTARNIVSLQTSDETDQESKTLEKFPVSCPSEEGHVD